MNTTATHLRLCPPLYTPDDTPAAVRAQVVTYPRGEDLWGKDCKVHFYASSIVIEQFPPDGQIRGKQAAVYKLGWHSYDPPAFIYDVLPQLIADVAANSYAAVILPLKTLQAAHPCDIAFTEETQQKAHRAPRPADAALPKDHANSNNVGIRIDANDRSITIKDWNDRNNEPTIYTQGPTAYKTALKTYDIWKDMPFNAIWDYWASLRVKNHYYCAID